MRSDSARPTVSIVIPVFNQKADYLRRCIASVLAQNYPDFELIISNNHSTNGCEAVFSEFTDSRIRLVRPPQHLSMAHHFAYAAFQADGQFISFLPSDDWVETNWLEEMLRALNNYPVASFAYCDVFKHDLRNNQVSRYRGDGYPSRYLSRAEAMHVFGKLLTEEMIAWVTGALIRSDAYFQYCGGQWAGITHAGDLAFGLELIRYGGVVYVGQPLANNQAWTQAEGKSAESKWYALSCQDAAKVLDWARNDLVLADIAKQSKFSFFKARARMTTFFLLSYIQLAIDENDNRALLDSFQKALKMISKGWLPIWSTSIFRISMVTTLMNYLRAKLGRRVRKAFL